MSSFFALRNLPSLSPMVLATLVVLALAIVGVIVAVVRSARTFRGYAELTEEVRAIARAVKGDVFRDGNDLVVAGDFGVLPTVVRFSHAETTPGLNVRMGAPATFTLMMAGKGSAAVEGRTAVRTGSELLDTRFSTRSDHPNEARILLAGDSSLRHLEKICCSGRSLFALSPGLMELSELVIPEPDTAGHVIGHLREMAALAAALEKMPGAQEVKIAKLPRDRSSPLLKVSLVVGVAAVVALLAETRGPLQGHEAPPAEAAEPVPAGVRPVDAALIPRVWEWRVAEEGDFDADAAAWLRGVGQPVSGKLQADFSGKGQDSDVVYVLVRRDGTRRLVLLVGGESRYDANYGYIGLLARVPKSAVGRVKWLGSPPQDVDGDGLLVTRKKGDVSSGLVIFSSGRRIASGVPANYQNLPLR